MAFSAILGYVHKRFGCARAETTYAINNHMFLIKEEKVIRSLVKSIDETKKTIITNAFTDDEDEKNDIFKDAIIYDNISI
jgi:hypothetical protein